MEFSTLIGKLVLSPEGETCGYVTQIYLSKNFSSLACLVCADDEEEEFILPASAVRGISDVIIAGNARLQSPKGTPCPVGKSVYDEQGVFLGVACALTDGENGELTVVDSGTEQTFPTKRITALGAVVVHNKTVPKKRPSTRKKSCVKKPEAVPPSASAPIKITTEKPIVYRMNILGMEVQQTVSGLAEQGERVTAEMLRRARESNRLLELTSGVLTRK